MAFVKFEPGKHKESELDVGPDFRKPGESVTAKPTSKSRGKPVADLLARIEQTHPGIAEEIGVSSAALQAGQLVRAMRKSRDWTQTQLAEALGWDQVRISNIERGEGTRGPTFDVLQKVASACDYDVQFVPRAPVKAERNKPHPSGRLGGS